MGRAVLNRLARQLRPPVSPNTAASASELSELRDERAALQKKLREVNLALSEADGEPQGPLAGVTIIEAQQAITGPLGTMMLADMGASVIKIEPPTGQGDVNRPSGTIRPSDADHGVYMHNFNRGKRCIALDLTKEEGQAVLLEMAKTADVFLQNARPGAADRNGFGYAALSAVNDELIYVSISGWGQTGPYARRPA